MFGDVVEIEIKEKLVNRQLVETAEAQGWMVEDEFVIEMKHNHEDAACDGPLVYSILKPDQMKKKWAVMTLIDGEIIQCQTLTYQTRICFKSYGSEEYVLVSKNSVNANDNTDQVEVITSEQNNSVPIVLELLIKVVVSVLVLSIAVVSVLIVKKSKIRKRNR